MAFSAVSSRPSQTAFDDRQKANLAAVALSCLWVVVTFITVFEHPVFGKRQLTGTGFTVFTMGDFFLIAYFLLLANFDEIKAMPKMLAGITREGTVKIDYATDNDRPGVLERAFRNLWVPVTLEFLLAGWLVYASGGIVNSPYVSVPIVMMMIGQSVYHVPPIEFDVDARMLGIPMFAARVTWQYRYPILILLVLLPGLVLLQAYHPLARSGAPPEEDTFTALVGVVVCMCTTYVTRCFDRAGSWSAS